MHAPYIVHLELGTRVAHALEDLFDLCQETYVNIRQTEPFEFYLDATIHSLFHINHLHHACDSFFVFLHAEASTARYNIA